METKRWLCSLAIGVISVVNGQEEYSLGYTYNKLKDYTYADFTRNCGYGSSSVADLEVTMRTGREPNTLISQIETKEIKDYYYKFIDKIANLGSQIRVLGNDPCSRVRYDYQKTLLEYYSDISDKYAEWDDLHIDWKWKGEEFYRKQQEENQRIVNAKYAENKQRFDELDAEYDRLVEQSGINSLEGKYEDKIESTRNLYHQKIQNVENNAHQRIKALSTQNFSANKAKILKESENRKEALRAEMERVIHNLQNQYDKEDTGKRHLLEQQLSIIREKQEEINRYDYKSLMKNEKFDDTEYRKSQEKLLEDMKNLSNEYATALDKIIKRGERNEKIVPILQSIIKTLAQ